MSDEDIISITEILHPHGGKTVRVRLRDDFKVIDTAILDTSPVRFAYVPGKIFSVE